MAGRTVMVGLLVALGIVERRLLLLAAAPGVHGSFLCAWSGLLPMHDPERVSLTWRRHLVVMRGEGGPRHRRIRPLAAGAIRTHHHRDVRGHALGLMDGEGVAAVESVVLLGIDGHLTVVRTLEGERAPFRIDAGDDATGTVAYPDVTIVGQADDPVARLVILVSHAQRRPVHASVLHGPGTGELVERCHLVPAAGEHDRV